MLLSVQYSRMIDPIASMEGSAATIGALNPASYFITIARGAFSKGLGFADLGPSFVGLVVASPVLLGLSVLFLKKQAK